MNTYEQGLEAGMTDEEARFCHLPTEQFDEIFADYPKRERPEEDEDDEI